MPPIHVCMIHGTRYADAVLKLMPGFGAATSGCATDSMPAGEASKSRTPGSVLTKVTKGEQRHTAMEVSGDMPLHMALCMLRCPEL